MGSHKSAIDAFTKTLDAILAPMDTRSVVEWCEDEVVLSERQTSMPGNFSTRMTPYLREPLECFGDVDVSDLVLVFGTQTGKTTAIQAGTAWRVCNKPQPCLWILPTEGLARSFSETRWMPLFDDSPTLAAQKPSDRHKWKTLSQSFVKSQLDWVGSNSPAQLSSRPCGTLLMDELDKFARETEAETSAMLLAENRTKSFVGALRVKTSTPTIPDGNIWGEYLKGSMEKFMLPCPHCKERIELIWSMTTIVWDQEARKDGKWDMQRVEESAHYVCQKCGGKIIDGMKSEMILEGKWEATNPGSQKGFRSFHLNSLYAPWRSCTFGALAVKFLRDSGTLNGLQDFTNSTLALPWENSEENIGSETITSLRGDYHRGSCPIEPEWVFIGADIGQTKQHWVTTAFAENGESYILDYGTCLAVEDLLGDMVTRQYKTPGGNDVSPDFGLMDSGYSTFKCYAVCQESSGFWYSSKGSDASAFRKPITENVVDGFPGVVLYTYADKAIKDQLFVEQIKKRNPAVHLPKDAGSDLMRGMSGQMRVKRKTAFGSTDVWKAIAEDHYMDAFKLTHVAWQRVKMG